MSVAFVDVFNVGDHLLRQGGEPSDRSASSRHYYAALHASEQWLGTTPGMPSVGSAAGGSHDQLAHKLRNLDRLASQAQKDKGKKLAARLTILKARRVVADYKLGDQYRNVDAVQQRVDAAAYITDCTSPP